MNYKLFFQLIFINLCLIISCTENNQEQQKVTTTKSPISQKKTTYKEMPISGTAYLRFYKFNKTLNLYFEPKLVINSQRFEVKGYDSSTYGNKGTIKAVSPNGNYFIIDLIKKDTFKKGTKILAIHTGGLQGIEGFNERLKKKNQQIIK